MRLFTALILSLSLSAGYSFAGEMDRESTGKTPVTANTGSTQMLKTVSELDKDSPEQSHHWRYRGGWGGGWGVGVGWGSGFVGYSSFYRPWGGGFGGWGGGWGAGYSSFYNPYWGGGFGYRPWGGYYGGLYCW